MRKTLVALAALLASASALADTLVDNANGIQVDAQGKLQRFDGLLIGDDGRVKQLLSSGEARPSAAARIDAGGKTLLPGLIDAHGHVMSLGFGALQLDLTGTTSLKDLQQRLRTYAAANPDSSWILGRGWNQEMWADKRFPTAADLDAVVRDRPVWLGRVDGHASVANSAALAAAGVTPETKAPEGGRIENGLFVDAAMSLVESKIPAPTPAEHDLALARAQKLMLANGLTAAADMGTSPSDWAAMNRAGGAGTLNVRMIGYAGGIPSMQAINGGKPVDWLYGDRLRLVGVKLYSDGALGSRGAWLKSAYHDKPDTRGLQFLTDARDPRASQGRPPRMATSLLSMPSATPPMPKSFRPMSILAQHYPGDRRWRIEHFQIADPSDIPRLQAGRDHCLDAADPPDQRPADGRGPAGSGPRSRALMPGRPSRSSGSRSPSAPTSRWKLPNPFPGLAAASAGKT